MKNLYIITLYLAYFILNVEEVNSQYKKAYQLPALPSYVILAPKQVRPLSFYQASVSIMKMIYPTLTIRMTIKDDTIEYSHFTVKFRSEGTEIMRLEIPSRAGPSKNYYLEIIGSVEENSAIIFSNRTKLEYKSQEYSAFIQMSKPVYHQGQTVQFRIIPVKPNLMPQFGTVSNVKVKDANGFVVKRWLNPTTNIGGIYEFQFPLADQVAEGMWSVEFDAEKWNTVEKFEVREFWLGRFDVNVSIPVRFSQLGFGVFGTISANETSGMPVVGNGTVRVEVRDPSLEKTKTEPLVTLEKEISFFNGQVDFLFTMDEMKDKLSQGSLANKDVWVYATVYNRFQMMTRTSWAYSYIYSDKTQIKIFGGAVRPFKPDMPFTAYISISQPDGTAPVTTVNRRVEIEVKCQNTVLHVNKHIVVPSDGIIRHTFNMNTVGKCLSAELRATYKDDNDVEISTAIQRLFVYQSFSKAYMQITMATERPKVNEFAVFHLQMNYPTNHIYYQIISGGNIVYVDKIILNKPVRTRTISLAISRDMAPIARLIAFFVKTDGEIVSDSLTFFVNITNINNVNVRINRGKDLNVDTVEVNGYAEPGSYLVLNALHYDLYRRGANNILRDYNVMNKMMEYESDSAQKPYKQDWYHNLEYIERTYIPAPSGGADTNTTFDNAGVFLYSDAAFIKVNFNHDCNETISKNDAFPCYVQTGKQCYSRKQRCDGVGDCSTWADEAGCPEVTTNTNRRKDMMQNFDLTYRHWNDGAWLWKSYWVKPNGRINFRVDLPKMDTSWVVGAFAIDRLKGFSIIERPAVFSGIRRFYMVVEAPEESYYGEQIGVRLTLFNYWDYWTEALVVVEGSKEFKNVLVGEYGRVRAYNLRTSENVDIHTLVYLSAGESRYVFIPIIPKGPGNSTFKVCAYTFIGANCETRKFRVVMNGVASYYHHSTLIDLVSTSERVNWNFKIPLRQSFYEPEERDLRFVPDSKLAVVTVSGDVFGPTISEKLPYFQMEKGLRLTHGALENVFFDFGYNVQLLKYLRKAESSSIKVTRIALDYCNKVLQDAFSYYDTVDGGFANFREKKNGSQVLATAFALWNLYSVIEGVGDWDRFIHIPQKVLDESVKFLEGKQVQELGIFFGSFETSGILDSRFMPTDIDEKLSDDEKEAQRRVPITAMVILGLTEKKNTQTDVIGKGVQFLKKAVYKTKDVFSKLIATYALIQSGDKGVQNVVSQMASDIEKSTKGVARKYFSNTEVQSIQSENNNAGQIVMYPRNELPNDGYTVASTSLGMLIMTEENIWKEGDENIMKLILFLADMRNHVSGFASTFDSLMAIRALNKFSTLDRNRKWYKFFVKQTLTSDVKWSREFFVDRFNYSVGNQTTIPNDNVWGEVALQTEGTGRVLLQLDTSARFFQYKRLKNPKDPQDINRMMNSFNVYCMPQFSGRNSSIVKMTICANWAGTTGVYKKPEAGLTVFEVSIPTGFVVLNDELRRYVESGVVPDLRYARFWPGKINFYLERLKPTNTCVTFRGDRYFPVSNITRDQLCSAFEYYEPGRYNRSIYKVQSLYTNSICNVFGSYQCPYSPFYNFASGPVQCNIILLFISSLLAVLYIIKNHAHAIFG